MRDMKTVEAPNLKLLEKSHENKWVAFSRDRKKLVGVGDTLQSLRQVLEDEKINRDEAVVMKVLPFNVIYAPNSRA